MANTYDAQLVVDTVSDMAITVLGNRFAPFRAFSRDFGVNPLNPRETVQVEISGTAASASTNPASYAGADSTNSNVAVTVAEHHVAFYLTAQELMQGHKVETKVQNHLNTLADAVWAVPEALINDTNFSTNTPVTVAQASFVTASRNLAWGRIAKSPEKHLILDGVAYAQNLPTDKDGFTLSTEGAFGWNGIHLATQWSNAGTNCYGIACGPNAIAIAAGLPNYAPGVLDDYIASEVLQLNETGLSVLMTMWTNRDTRQLNVSFDLMFGAALGDETAGVIIESA